jgi:hypothetical protein
LLIISTPTARHSAFWDAPGLTAMIEDGGQIYREGRGSRALPTKLSIWLVIFAKSLSNLAFRRYRNFS